MPELPNQKREKLIKLGIKTDDVEVLVGDLARIERFEEALAGISGAKQIQAIAALLVHKPEVLKLSTDKLKELAALPPHLQKTKLAGEGVSELEVSKLEVRQAVEEVIKSNSKVVADIKKGKKQAIGVLVGQVMTRTKGATEPQKVKQIIESVL